MAMSSDQETAFENATAGIPAADVGESIALVIGMIALLWLAWLLLGLFNAWRRNNLDLHDLTWGVLRGSVVVIVITYFIR